MILPSLPNVHINRFKYTEASIKETLFDSLTKSMRTKYSQHTFDAYLN